MGLLILRPFKSGSVIYYQDAGPDQYAICTTNISLTATVVGDLRGHAMLWEQISGTSAGVTVTSPTNQLVLTYTNSVPPGNFDDKTWRFWIDKGSPKQLYSDVTVYGTPTSNAFASSNSVPRSRSLNYGPALGCRNPVLELLINFPTNQTSSATCGSLANSALRWPSVCDSNNLLGYSVEKRTGAAGAWTFVAVTSNTVFPGPLTNGDTYRIIATYLEGSGKVVDYHSNEVGVVYPVSEIGTFKELFAVSPASVTGIGSPIGNRITNLTTTLLSLKTLDAPVDFPDDAGYAGNYPVIAGTQRITNYLVQPLTGGGIGG